VDVINGNIVFLHKDIVFNDLSSFYCKDVNEDVCQH